MLCRDVYDFVPPDYRLTWDNPSVDDALRTEDRCLLGILSASYNGYVREAAVRALAEFHDGFELPFLLLRANDWVPQVKTLAWDAIERRLTPEYVPRFLACLDLIDALYRTQRVDCRPLLDKIEALLRTPAARTQLIDALRTPNPHARRRLWRTLAPTLAQSDPLWELALRDASVAKDAARHLAEALPANDLALRVKPLLGAPGVAGVAAHLLARLAERNPEVAAPLLDEALFSPAATVRSGAQFYRRSIDVAQVYREALAQKPSPATALGLGETGTSDDVALLAALVDAPQPMLRAAALTATARLGGESRAPKLLSALRDPSPTVRRAAARALTPFAHGLTAELSALCLDPSVDTTTRRRLLHAFAETAFWTAAPVLLRLLVDPDLQDRARIHLDGYARRWRISAFTRPTPAQRAAIDAALADPDVRRQAPRWIAQVDR